MLTALGLPLVVFLVPEQEEQLRHDLVGSWAFMAPEVLQRAHHPQAADMCESSGPTPPRGCFDWLAARSEG